MENQQTINYIEELKTLNEGGLRVWKAKQGKYKVEILAEPHDAKFVKDSGETIEQWRIEAKINNEAQTWFIPKSSGKNSIRGQLIKLATTKGNKLTGVLFDLWVQGEGKERRYTIPEIL